MKKIRLPLENTMSLSLDTKNIPLDQVAEINGNKVVKFGTIDFAESNKELEAARENGGQVLYATTSIENKIEYLLSTYFFGPVLGLNDRRDLFINALLQSSHITFSFKKDLAQKIIHNNNLLKGKKKNALQTKLKQIVEWRNAFAHGQLVHDGKAGCMLRYFSSSPKALCLDDAYWSTVETCFAGADKLLDEATSKLMELFTTEQKRNSG